ncbi:SRPBCC family protein [Solirubrobacter phytolaccae]|uniref:SRPBCC family protein n=1 Tax=Solirubrobacter phytolaccae TaxID=1404360 RepID=A0A9X3SFI5_9ACTN|nr:SRPBCC family protein [Solirubrobacter phytolaccae]MDA0181562.1 SRPBCC family protein [Solirubrobacter phytolaccae]
MSPQPFDRKDPMETITRSVRLGAEPDAVWAVVGDFARIADWHPDVSAPELRGAERVFADGLVERLVERDPGSRRLVYSMPQPPFPIRDHVARLTVSGLEDGTCEVTWSASFNADPQVARELEGALGDGVFATGLAALTERFGGA